MSASSGPFAIAELLVLLEYRGVEVYTVQESTMTSEQVLRPAGATVDYSQSSSLAELACRWAEQRRLALEVHAYDGRVGSIDFRAVPVSRFISAT